MAPLLRLIYQNYIVSPQFNYRPKPGAETDSGAARSWPLGTARPDRYKYGLR